MKLASFRLLPAAAEKLGAAVSGRLAGFFAALGFRPNTITVLSLGAGAAAGRLLWAGRPFWAGTAIVVCGMLDTLDGRVALITGRRTRFGALLDSTLDRYAEFFLYFGLALYFRGRWPQWLAFAAFLGSTMVSYTRARAEGLGFECRAGVMQRAERLVLLGLACLAACVAPVYAQAMIVALAAIAVLSNFTALQRLWMVRRLDRG